MMNRLKRIMAKVAQTVKRLETIIICLVILVLFGMALLQVNDAIDPSVDVIAEQKAQQEQLLKQIRYDQKSLEKIRELTNIEVNLEPAPGNHSDNPFSTD